MLVRPLFSTTLMILVMGLLPVSSQAQTCEAPPGSSAVDQYCEAIPEGGGSQSSDDFNRSDNSGAVAGSSSGGGGGTGGTSGQTASPAAEELEAAGADGAAVSGLTKTSGASATKTTTSQGAVAGDTASSEPSGSPLKAVSASVENGSTVGSGLIWGLLAVTLVLAALGWVAYRRHDNPDTTQSPPPKPDPS
ncbi:MAG: hypothetical protein JHC95_02215 [Solirubrobacteraceae bacterium]|nr:hypothetical protein [Solirubrobacteraceae bacterium]